MLTEFLDKHHIEWSTTGKHSRSGWTQLQECPVCSSQNYHLGIKNDLSRSSCYVCGGKNVAKLLKELTKASWGEIYKLLGNRAYLPREEIQEHTGTYTPPTQVVPFSKAGSTAAYLKQRGYDLDYCEKVWGLGATGPFSDYPFRVFIPITHRKRPVSWTARAAKGQEPRYQTAMEHQKSMDEKKLLFGADKARDKVIVVEGPLGAIRVGVGAVATMGLAVTQAQLSRLTEYQSRVICFDSEPAAQRRANRLAEQLASFPGHTSVVELDADDPGEIAQAEKESLRKFAFGSAAEWA